MRTMQTNYTTIIGNKLISITRILSIINLFVFFISYSSTPCHAEAINNSNNNQSTTPSDTLRPYLNAEILPIYISTEGDTGEQALMRDINRAISKLDLKKVCSEILIYYDVIIGTHGELLKLDIKKIHLYNAHKSIDKDSLIQLIRKYTIDELKSWKPAKLNNEDIVFQKFIPYRIRFQEQ